MWKIFVKMNKSKSFITFKANNIDGNKGRVCIGEKEGAGFRFHLGKFGKQILNTAQKLLRRLVKWQKWCWQGYFTSTTYGKRACVASSCCALRNFTKTKVKNRKNKGWCWDGYHLWIRSRRLKFVIQWKAWSRKVKREIIMPQSQLEKSKGREKKNFISDQRKHFNYL